MFGDWVEQSPTNIVPTTPWLPTFQAGSNLAQGRPAFSFNTLLNTYSTADKAVDGFTDTVRTSPYCSISYGDQPWW